MPINVVTRRGGIFQLKASFSKNWIYYLQEALGLAIFMISACYFGSMLEAKNAYWHLTVTNNFSRSVIMGILMGATALFIFYAPFTSPSGAHINPAVTLSFLRLGKINTWDAIFYIVFQFAGGTLAVYMMQWLIGPALTAMPVSSVVTIPGKAGWWPALLMEFAIAFITMSMVLFTAASARLKKYTRIIAGCMVCCYVIIAGPVSGFGMNPARSFASALPAGIWTCAWIYMIIPVAGMLGATELYLRLNPVKGKIVANLKRHFKQFANSIMKQLLRNFILIPAILLLPYGLIAQVNKITAIGFTVSNMEKSVQFYHDVLGFKKISDREVYGDAYEQLQGIFGLRMRIVRMQLGDEQVELTDYLTSGGRSIPENMMSNDLVFQHIAIVVSNMDKAYVVLRKHMVMQVSTGPQTLPASNIAAAGVKAFYFHDPDMHNLELIYFPKGKGQPKWQTIKGKLFMGIDHTAIAVSNTENSLRFYEGIFGIMRKGDSWNMGTEQAHLNFVKDASLHITGLRSPEGPGIEFLEYLQPGPGKIYPADSKTDDLWHWQTTAVVADVVSLYKKLESAGYKFISNGIVSLPSGKRKENKAFIVRDADGHAMLVTDADN